MEVVRLGASNTNDLLIDWPAPKRPKKLPQADELWRDPEVQALMDVLNVSGDPPLTTTLSIAQDSSLTPPSRLELKRKLTLLPVNPVKVTVNF